MRVTKKGNTIKVIADEGKFITSFKEGDDIRNYMAYDWVVGDDLDYTQFRDISAEENFELMKKRQEIIDNEIEEIIL